jgi:hypothetical protein
MKITNIYEEKNFFFFLIDYTLVHTWLYIHQMNVTHNKGERSFEERSQNFLVRGGQLQL